MVDIALLSLLLGIQIAAQQSPAYRIEREKVRGGAELVTVFGHAPATEPGAPREEIPLVSVLRDTLGSPDPESSRLRYVWILTSTRPTVLQRAASAASFLWFRTGGKEHADQVPKPVLDLASPGMTVWSHLAGNAVQAMQFDALGAIVRSSTRSYRGNSSDYRQLQIYRALAALQSVEQAPGASVVWPASESLAVYSRLSLANRTFGGLVKQQNLPKVYDKETSRRTQVRGHNWELLRQRAEANGLYFQPLALPGQAPTQALLWVARTDLDSREHTNFDRQFLGIASPWSDDRLLHWSGYSEIRYFDSDNRPVSAEAPDARGVEMIPLALYGLDYPRVPLLLVDFRSSMRAKKRELIQHGSKAVITGALGITTFGNLSFFAANTTWNFIRGRHGAPTNSSERLRSYSEAREFLAADDRLAPELKAQLRHRLDHLALNPLENPLDTEARVAKEQFAALMQFAHSEDGLAAKLDRDRQKELAAYGRSAGMRFLSGVGGFLRAGGNTNVNQQAVRSELEMRRQASARILYLRQLLASSPRPEIIRETNEIRETVQRLSSDKFFARESSPLLAQLFERSDSFEIRMACLSGLRRLHLPPARNELLRLAQDPKLSDFWRAASLATANREPAAAVAAGAGQF